MQCRFVSNLPAIGFLFLAIPCLTRPPDYRAKADYLLLFLRYVTWPASAFPYADSPLVIGVPGDDPYGALLDSAFSGAVRQGRKIRVRRLFRVEDAEGIHVAFFSRGAPPRQGSWLDRLRSRPILTVVEDEQEFESGAIIHLAMVEGRLRFDVNLPSLRKSGLRIDSPMLLSARRIVRKNGSG